MVLLDAVLYAPTGGLSYDDCLLRNSNLGEASLCTYNSELHQYRDVENKNNRNNFSNNHHVYGRLKT